MILNARFMKKVVLFIGLFERGDDENKLTAESFVPFCIPVFVDKPDKQ